jgi:hypothetical protein
VVRNYLLADLEPGLHGHLTRSAVHGPLTRQLGAFGEAPLALGGWARHQQTAAKKKERNDQTLGESRLTGAVAAQAGQCGVRDERAYMATKARMSVGPTS